MKAKDTNCSLCSCPGKKVLFSKHGYDWVKCLDCSMVYINPQLTEKAISELEQMTYFDKTTSLKKRVQPQYFKILNNIQMLLKSKGNLLDVGCFEADFLNVAKKRDWKVYGTEISKGAIDFALKNYNIKIDEGNLIDIKYNKQFFDAIVMDDTIEHLPDPKSYVKEVSQIIKKGGVFYIGTPNFNSLSRYILGKRWNAVIFPWHLQYFTLRTLKKLLSEHGFEIKKVVTRDILFTLVDPHKKIEKIKVGKSVKGKTFTERVLNFGLNKVFNILFHVLDSLDIYMGGQIELYAIRK